MIYELMELFTVNQELGNTSFGKFSTHFFNKK